MGSFEGNSYTQFLPIDPPRPVAMPSHVTAHTHTDGVISQCSCSRWIRSSVWVGAQAGGKSAPLEHIDTQYERESLKALCPRKDSRPSTSSISFHQSIWCAEKRKKRHHSPEAHSITTTTRRGWGWKCLSENDTNSLHIIFSDYTTLYHYDVASLESLLFITPSHPGHSSLKITLLIANSCSYVFFLQVNGSLSFTTHLPCVTLKCLS